MSRKATGKYIGTCLEESWNMQNISESVLKILLISTFPGSKLLWCQKSRSSTQKNMRNKFGHSEHLCFDTTEGSFSWLKICQVVVQRGTFRIRVTVKNTPKFLCVVLEKIKTNSFYRPIILLLLATRKSYIFRRKSKILKFWSYNPTSLHPYHTFLRLEFERRIKESTECLWGNSFVQKV